MKPDRKIAPLGTKADERELKRMRKLFIRAFEIYRVILKERQDNKIESNDIHIETLMENKNIPLKWRNYSTLRRILNDLVKFEMLEKFHEIGAMHNESKYKLPKQPINESEMWQSIYKKIKINGKPIPNVIIKPPTINIDDLRNLDPFNKKEMQKAITEIDKYYNLINPPPDSPK